MRFIIFVLLILLIGAEDLTKADLCSCPQLLNQADCAQQSNCQWVINSCITLTSPGQALLPQSVLCSSIIKPSIDCSTTLGCAYVGTSCVFFTGCTAYVQQTNNACQLISRQCTSNGITCISPQPCSTYTQVLCQINLSSSGSGKCVWDNSVCRDQICSEAPTTLNTDALCNSFIAGCLSTGFGCVQSRLSCSTYTGNITTCAQMIGSDGKCTSTSATNAPCSAKQCSQYPAQQSTNASCANFQIGCISSGLGCLPSPLPLCSTYLGTKWTCQNMLGSDGICDTQDNIHCKLRQCSDASIGLNTNALCDAFLKGCVTNGMGCVTQLQPCSSNSGTINSCAGLIGTDGYCEGVYSSQITSCRAKQCINATPAVNTNALCAAYQIGCLTNGNGCVAIQLPCSSYSAYWTSTNDGCNSYIGSDGSCKALTHTATTFCTAILCTDAPTTLTTNAACNAFSTGCITTGTGCVLAQSCANTPTQQLCKGTTNCSWNPICVPNTSCALLTTPSLCLNNTINGQACFWTGTTCRLLQCSDGLLTTTTQCNTFLAGCVTNGTACVSPTNPCSTYFGNQAQCSFFTGNSIPCYNISSATATSSCLDKTCTLNTTATTDSACQSYMSGCLTTGPSSPGCISSTAPCSSYQGTQSTCSVFVGLNLTQLCWGSVSGGACSARQCSDAANTNVSNSSCNGFLAGCLTNGAGCISSTAPCTQYTGSSTATCSQFTGNSIPCWWSGGSNCVNKTCSLNTTATTNGDCSTFMAGCLTKGVGCIDPTQPCSAYSGNQTTCSAFVGNSLQCIGRTQCQVRQCTDLTSASQQSDCINYLASCRFNGTGCVTASTCNSFTGTAAFCQALTDNSPTPQQCYLATGSGTCQLKTCSMLTSAANQGACDSFLTGCIWTGAACVAKAASCTLYTSFTSDLACQAAVDTSGQSCWRQTGSGTCVNRACTDTIPTLNLSTCQSHMVGYAAASQCTYNGAGCVQVQAQCPSYTGFTQAACQAASTITGQPCWLVVAGPGACLNRTCTHALNSNASATYCQSFLPNNACVYNGAGCVPSAPNCTQYGSFTSAACLTAVTSGLIGCQVPSPFSGICASRSCTDSIPNPSATVCYTYSSICRFNGTSCVIQQATCSAYTPFTPAACMATTDVNGNKCTQTDSTSITCQSRSCSDTQSTYTAQICAQYIVVSSLPQCAYNGTQCIQIQSTCSGYTNQLPSQCQNLLDSAGNPCYLSGSVTGQCWKRRCIDNTTATNNSDCNTFLAGCVTTGQGCISNASNCSDYFGTSTSCPSFTGADGKCKAGSGANVACSTLTCYDNRTATTDAQCNAFLKGCVSNGLGCYPASEPCTSYQGTATTCSGFTGQGKQCYNIATAAATSQCLTKTCSTNTSGTSDATCSAYLTGCLYNGQGCVDSTQPCSQYFGTQNQCMSYNAVSGTTKCWNPSTAITTTPCIQRVCSQNIIDVSDAACNVFLSGCVTKGIGCTSPQPCASFTGTSTTCPLFTATDGPCGSNSGTNAACYSRGCSSAPNNLTTDAQCNSFKSGCFTNGAGCASTVSCNLMQSQSACQSKTGCMFVGSCMSTQLTCASINTAAECVSAIVSNYFKKCAWSGTACQDYTCANALATLNTHTQCQTIDPTCTTSGAGCVLMGKCSTYNASLTCSSAKSTDIGVYCIWDSTNVCRARKCSDASTTYTTTNQCANYLPGCTTSGAGCLSSTYTCGQIKSLTLCTNDSSYYPCVWMNGVCLPYASCSDLTYTTTSQCQNFSSQCISNGSTCKPISLCSTYTQLTCAIGTDGTCGYLVGSATTEGKCQKFGNCSDAVYNSITSCAAYSSTCVTDGTKCIQKTTCQGYTTQQACNIGTDGNCKWTGTLCRLLLCTDATTEVTITTNAGCALYTQASAKCVTNSTNCIPIGLCSAYTQASCSVGTDGTCIYAYPVGQLTGTKLCRLQQCSDLTATTTAACTALQSGCISDGTACLAQSVCASYTTKVSCRSGGIDGVCAFTSSTSNANIGTCALVSTCSAASNDSTACQSLNCFYSGNSCANYNCTTYANATGCYPYPTQTGWSICLLANSTSCIPGSASMLASQWCYSLSRGTYSWNATSNLCQKCVQPVVNNTNNTNNTATYGTMMLAVLIWINY